MNTKNISLAILFVSFASLVGCGSHAATADTSTAALLARIDALEADRDAEHERAERLMTGAPATDATSGGSTATAAPYSSGGPIMVGTGAAPTSAMMSCDGIDSMGMVTTGMVTETMAYGPGDRPWEHTGASTGGLRHRFDYSGAFPIAIAINGHIVHEFSGSMPTSATMRTSGGGYCSMPVIPPTTTDQYSSRNYVSYDVMFDEMARYQHVQIMCLSGGSGRASRTFATFGMDIDMSSTSGYSRITDDDCRNHMGGA